MSERLVYYYLVCTEGGRSERQWVQSIRSLRRYNTDVPVVLFAFDVVPDWIRAEATGNAVTLCELGRYRDVLRDTYTFGDVHGDVLASHPTLLKFFVWPSGSIDERWRVLCLDCDTFFFDDVERLFEFYATSDVYAREEPCSRLSRWGYDPSHVDEDALGALQQHECARAIVPFNTGVTLFSGYALSELGRFRHIFLDTVWRLLVGLALDASSDIDTALRSAVLRTSTAYERELALPYPSRNGWIIDQIAAWLTLGRIRGLSQGLIEPRHSTQSSEFHEVLESGDAIVSHYFSACEADFFACVQPL